jgi:hypothetical protein
MPHEVEKSCGTLNFCYAAPISDEAPMDSAYIRALNAGLLRQDLGDGVVRDRAILREARLLFKATPPKPAIETEAVSDPEERSTIPPPRWRDAPR